jgi:hypothetical protein
MNTDASICTGRHARKTPAGATVTVGSVVPQRNRATNGVITVDVELMFGAGLYAREASIDRSADQ